MGQEAINKNIERNTFSPMYLSEERAWQRFLSCRLPLLSMGDGEGPQDRLPHWR